jgi:molybdopterin-guanine dinucleotide biosynthesis protein A
MILKGNKGILLRGLVLAGGKSKRMGQDKTVMRWHDKEQRYYVAEMLSSLCDDVFISCREEQVSEIDANYKTLSDAIADAGPSGAILTAFKKYPESAWLVVACDLPLLDAATLQYLIEQRDINKAATTFESPYDGLPEPLITIWEPKSFQLLSEHIAEGFTCPRKALIRNADQVKIVKASSPDALINTNTPEDVEKVKAILNTSHAA